MLQGNVMLPDLLIKNMAATFSKFLMGIHFKDVSSQA